MGSLANVLMRIMGMGKAVDALDGATSKAYIGGVGLILTGLVSLLTGSAHVLSQVFAAHGGAAYFDILKSLYAGDADTALFIAGAAAVSKGIAEIGARHALAKAQSDANSVPLPNAK